MAIATVTTSLAKPATVPLVADARPAVAPWQLGPYLLPRSVEDSVVELRPAFGERVLLAMDMRVRRFVELHIVAPSHPLSPEEEVRVKDNLSALRRLRLSSVPLILDIGTEQGMTFYTTVVRNTLTIDEWCAHVGRMEVPTAARLVNGLVRDLRVLQRHHPEILPMVQMNDLLVQETATQGAQLVLAGFDLHHVMMDKSFGAGNELAINAALLFARLFSGSMATSGTKDELRDSGASKRLVDQLTDALAGPSLARGTLDALGEALTENANINAGAVRMEFSPQTWGMTLSRMSGSRVNDDSLVGLQSVLKNYFDTEVVEGLGWFPFMAEGRERRNGGNLRLGITPFSSFLEGYVSPQVPAELSRLQPARQPNIMAPVYSWHQGDMACVVDEKPSGMALTDLIAERERLPAHEALSVLEQLAYTIKQAEMMGVSAIDLHPAQVWLSAADGRDVRGMPIPWAGFRVRLRLHRNPESVFSAPMIEPSILSAALMRGAKQLEKEYALRSFPALAYWMLTGDEACRPGASLPESVSPAVRGFIMDCHRATHEDKMPGAPEWWINQLKDVVILEPAATTRALTGPLWVQPNASTLETAKPKTWVSSKSRPRSAWQLMA